MATTVIKNVMRIIWEGEGHKWDDLYEYPYSDWERKEILARLEKTAKALAALFAA